ncbi:hypothetical protein [Paenisporosarcina indica]|uniref:hypothetical protein n=1 Tax=Paenisporosarcina indica TaxID=650093 RepID=UPI00094FE572|nr:hypothetical protein [Paenisporosarcina indica]
MIEEKRTYYVDINSESILPEPVESTSFVIQATAKEVQALEAVFEKKYEHDLETYVRSHIPFLEYHHDPENDRYDASQKMIYAILYVLGNKEAKEHIEEMGIMTDNKSEDPEDIRHLR